jgi:hypothetical protein
MNSKSSISNFEKDWLSQSTSDKPIVIMSSDSAIPKRRITEFDLRLGYSMNVGGQHKHGQVGEIYHKQLIGYERWIEEKLLELLNE